MSRTRCSVLTLPRRAGTSRTHGSLPAWAPALQRTVEETLRCVRGTGAEFGAGVHRPVQSKRDHLVPISDATMAIVDTLSERDGYLFTINDTTPVSGFSKAKSQLDDAAGVKAPYRIYDFSVTCETRLASLGFAQKVRDAVLGHMTQGLQRRYNKHQYADEKREALDAYAQHLIATVS